MKNINSKWLFLRWVLLVALVIVVSVIIGKLGLFEFAWKMDIIKATFVIFAIFIMATIWCGRLTWRANKLVDDNDSLSLKVLANRSDAIENDAEHVNVAIDLSFLLGLLGTIVGISYAFFNPEGSAQAIESSEQLAPAVGTAFISTTAGIVSSVLLILQRHNVIHALRRAVIDKEGKDG